MSNSTATATTAATASGTVRSTDGHPIIIISARGSPDDEHAHSLQDSPPTSPTMLQHQGNERMLRFDADCVLIPPSTLHKKQHSRSQSLGRRPVLVTKSYSLPVLWKRKTSNEYEGTNGAAPEETPAVFKVSIPSFKTKKSPTIPSLSSPLHSPTTPTFQPQSILVNRQPTSPVSPLFSPSSPSQPRPQMKRFSSYGSTPSSSSSSTATPAHRELVPAISVTSATHTHTEETVPLRACCLACIHATEEPIRAGDTWEVKFTRGALRRRLSAQADDEAEASNGGGGGVTMRKAGDFSAVLAASPLSPSSLSSPSALMGPGTGGVAVGVLSTTSAGGVISVDEVDKRRRSSESSQQCFDGQHHLVGAVEEEEDEENEDEDELFPLPSPRSTPRPSPTPSPNGSSSSLTVNKDGATKNNNSSSSTSSSSGSHGTLKVAVPIPIVSSVPHPDRIYCASPARKMTCAWSSRSSSPGSQQQQGQPGCSSSSSSVNLRKAATSSFAAAAATTTTTTCDAAGGSAANLSGCRDKALAMMNANGSQDTLPIVGESSVEESQDDDDDDDEDEDEGEEGEVVGRGGTAESPRALYIPHLLRRGGKKKQSHVVHRADEVAYHEDVDEDGFIVLHAPADSTRHTPTSASSSRITDEELCAFLKEEAAAAAAQFSTASPSLGRQSGGAAAGDEPTSSPPVGTSYGSTAPMSIPIAAKPTTSPSLGFTLPSFLSSTSPSSPKDDRRSGGGGGGGGGLSISPTRQRARGILSRSLSRSRPSGQQSQQQQQQQLQPTDEVPTNTYANVNASNGNSHNSGAAITENGAADAPGTSPQTQMTTMPRRGRSQSFLKTGADMLRGVGQGLSLGSGSGMGGM